VYGSDLGIFFLFAVYKTPNAIRKKRELCHAIKDKRARAVSATRVNAAGESGAQTANCNFTFFFLFDTVRI
jgi:hypothetical protein